MAARYRHLLTSCDGFEPDEVTKQALIQSLVSGSPLPDLAPLLEDAVALVIGAGPPDVVRFATLLAEKFPEKSVISWHDPMLPEYSELEIAAARTAKKHICPTKPHRELLRRRGAEIAIACTPLLDAKPIELRDRAQLWDVCHFGWVGRGARDLPGLVSGVARARKPGSRWRVVQYGALPAGMPLQMIAHRLSGAFELKGEVAQQAIPSVYTDVRTAAVLQVGGFLGEMCIPGKLIEAVFYGCPPLCDRRGGLLTQVCDEANLPSWSKPVDVPGILEAVDGFVGEEFAMRLGGAIADCGVTEAFEILSK